MNKPLIKKFWSNGLFEPMNKRYFQLINRVTDLKNEILWDEIDTEKYLKDLIQFLKILQMLKKVLISIK